MVQGRTESHVVGTAGQETKFSKVSGLFFLVFLFVCFYSQKLFSGTGPVSEPLFFLPGNVNTEQYYLC